VADGSTANFRYCWFCGGWMIGRESLALPNDPRRRTREHLEPLSRGGEKVPENTVWACSRCNHEKRDLTVEEYRAVLAVRTGRIPVFWGETEAARAPDPLGPLGDAAQRRQSRPPE